MRRTPRFTLIRDRGDAERTFGVMFNGQMTICQTLEPTKLRVPPGFYLLEPHNGPKFKDTWALIGENVSHQKEEGVARAAVLLHAGNRDEDSRGCILVGLSRGELGGEPAVLQSNAAMERLRDTIGPRVAYLVIIDKYWESDNG